MLIFYTTLFVSVLNAAIAAEYQPLSSGFAKPKRGIVDTGHDGPRDYRYRQPRPQNARSIPNNNSKLYYYKDKTASREPLLGGPVYEGGFKSPAPYVGLQSTVRQQEAQVSDHSTPYFDNLFTISAGYKVGNEGAPVTQATRSQNAGVHGVVPSPNSQVPLYKTNYALPRATGSQHYSPTVQNSFNKKPSPVLRAQNNYPVFLNNYQSQPLIVNPVDQFSYPAKTPKVNNVQLSAPFLSPLSSFQGQVIPIATANNNPQFPQYKGAAIEVYPTVGGFSTVVYEPLQMQPQLHFGHGNGRPVGGNHNLGSAQEIRTDVEIVNKKKPTIPPPKNDSDDDDEDDDGSTEKDYGPDSNGDDDYDSKSGRHFTPSQTEGDFKPSTSFPFTQYDEKFGKYSNQNQEEEAEEKPFTKYSDYSSSNDDDEEEDVPSGKYHSDDSSSKPFYSKQEDEEEEDGHDYERQKSEDDTYRPKSFEKDFDEEFETSYKRGLPKQRYAHTKEVPEEEYGSRSSRRDKDHRDSEDPAGQGSHSNFNYYKIPRGFIDNEGESSDIWAEVAYEGGFGNKIPEKVRSYKHRTAGVH